MYNDVWGCAEILPITLLVCCNGDISQKESRIKEELGWPKWNIHQAFELPYWLLPW